RFATACGMSDRLRLDLVINDFVACAVASGNITILSDGTPWRPLIHVRDMARAIDWAVGRDREHGGDFLAVNVGSNVWNCQVKQLSASGLLGKDLRWTAGQGRSPLRPQVESTSERAGFDLAAEANRSTRNR